MLHFILDFYGVEIVAVIVIALLSWFFFDKRFKKRHGKQVPAGFQRTEEVMIDPVENKTLRVYYNEQTGERYYHEET